MVLDKGLKFLPPKSLNKFATFIDVHKYVRKLNIQRYFVTNPTRPLLPEITSHVVHSGLSNPSIFNPPCPMAPLIKVFRDMVLRDLEALPPKKTYSDPNIKIGLKSLCERKSLIIHPADKGGGILILDKPDYHSEITKILSDATTYIKLPKNPTLDLKKIIGGSH